MGSELKLRIVGAVFVLGCLLAAIAGYKNIAGICMAGALVCVAFQKD